MARKTYRADDLCFLLTAPDVEMGISTVGQWLDGKHMARGAMKKLFDEKLVLLNGRKTTPKEAVSVGDELRLQMPKERLDYEPMEMDLNVLDEDEDLLVLHKPIGITVNSQGQVSLANGVAQYFKNNGIKRKVRFLNRLDRDTSGCVVIAKSAVAQGFYQQQMENQTFEKWYTTKVEGVLEGSQIIDLPMRRSEDGIHQEVHPDGKMTRTAYKALGVYRLEEEPVENSDFVDSVGNITGGSARNKSEHSVGNITERSVGNKTEHTAAESQNLDFQSTAIMENTETTEAAANIDGVVPQHRHVNGFSYTDTLLTEHAVDRAELDTLSEEEQAQLITHVDIRLYTGKTHQIRVTMAHLGHPLVGDSLYGNAIPGRTYSLVAKRIVFSSMRTGALTVVEV